MILVYGGSSSGKSGFAEHLVCSTNIPTKYYLATMRYTEDTKERIHRHRELRKEKGFLTLEYDVDIARALKDRRPGAQGSAVLLECMSNLVANEMFRDGGVIPVGQCVDKILKDVETLERQTSSLVIVSGNVFEDGVAYDEGTQNYIRALGMINRALAAMADAVYEVVVGIGVKV